MEEKSGGMQVIGLQKNSTVWTLTETQKTWEISSDMYKARERVTKDMGNKQLNVQSKGVCNKIQN